jgi:UDP-glucose 4-epimerase
VLVTGKKGFLGSRLEGRGFDKPYDIRNVWQLSEALRGEDCVVHLAALKDVEGSYANPVGYWDVNVGGTIALLKAMKGRGVDRLVFASTVSIYGNSPYGATKRACEELIKSSGVKYGILRIHNMIPNPLHDQALAGMVDVYGDDFPTPDGTRVLDFMPVEEVVEAINLAVEKTKTESFCVDVATGVPTSVMDVVKWYGAKHRVFPRRSTQAYSVGDPSGMIYLRS